MEEIDDTIGRLVAGLMERRAGADACPELHVLSGFMDGTLSRTEREQVLRHLLYCPACYSAVSEAARIEEELDYERLEQEREFPKRLQLWNWFRSGIPRFRLQWIAPALAAAVLLLVWVASSPDRQSFPEMMSAVAADVSAERLNRMNNIDIKTAINYGFAAGLSMERAAFRVGVLTTGVEISLKAGDRRKAWLQLQPLISLLSSIEQSGTVTRGFREISDQLEKGMIPESIGDDVSAASILFDENESLFYLAFGQWIQASRLACANGGTSFPSTESIRYFSKKAEAHDLPDGVIRTLRSIHELKASPVSKGIRGDMEARFESILMMLF